jgi:Zn-dependent peptidase ImmA (M78 family)/transcriptional regulator with XRE-family HTH domain
MNYNTIILARESRGMNQLELAQKIDLSTANLSKMEQGMIQTTQEHYNKIAKATNYPLSFFNQRVIIQSAVLAHRKRDKVANKLLTKIDANINIVCLNVQDVVDTITAPPVVLPIIDVLKYGTASDCAKELRKFWGFKEDVMGNITALIEKHGIMVHPIDFETERVDSRTMLTDTKQPIIFINRTLQGDKLRFSLAFELGHIIMHLFTSPSFERDVAHEANLFSAELLMPEKLISKDFKNGVNINLLSTLKKKWKVSMQALLYRANDLGFVNDNQKRYILEQFNTRKIRRREPQELDIEIERPQLIQTYLDKYQKKLKLNKEDLPKAFHLTKEDYRNFYE